VTLQAPSYIARTAVAGAPVRHSWTEQDASDALLAQPQLTARLAPLTLRANLALSLGAAEWLAWRFSAELPDDEALQIIEAMWASMLDWSRFNFADLPDWIGQQPEEVGGPLDLGFGLLYEVFGNARERQPVADLTAQLLELPVRVLPDPEAYKAWRREVIRRFEGAYVFGDGDPVGPPIAREALDPAQPFSPAAAESQLEAIAPEVNRFLGPPEA